MIQYPRLAEELEIHRRQIARYREAEGIRDENLLESALARPQSGYYPDLISEAAALWESMSQNHPFVDGNKRVAWVTMHLFLAMNGVRVVADPAATYEFMIGLYESNSFRFENLEAWLRTHTQPRN